MAWYRGIRFDPVEHGKIRSGRSGSDCQRVAVEFLTSSCHCGKCMNKPLRVCFQEHAELRVNDEINC